ncbi:SHOCT domain-containing protein [Actinomyces viscosus]|uniref:SHOCT domain-containing protein n=1 Tax=Actinomyces viscosus TaxID=1656 RepID=UPI0028F1273B|nr:SHOCT domain-containing protein [Actinomyces viscosus]
MSISLERSSGGAASGGVPGVEAVAAASTAIKLVSTVTKTGVGLARMSGGLGVAVAGAGQLAKMMSGKSVLTIVTDQKIHTLTNQVKTVGAPIVKREHETVGEALERAGNSVLMALGCGPVGSNAPALPSGQVETSRELSSPGMSSEDIAGRLRELADLRDEGILDEADFLIAKRQLLGRL